MNQVTRPSYFAYRSPLQGKPSYGSGIQKFTPGQVRTRQRRVAGGLRKPAAARTHKPKSQHLHLSELLHVGEHLQAVVYGNDSGGAAISAVTNQRVLMYIKTPTFSKSEEYTFDVIAGADYGRSGVFTYLTLYTSSGTHTLRTLDPGAARHFAESIEIHCLVQHIDREMC